MGLIRAVVSVAIAYWVYQFLITNRERLQNVKYIGKWLARFDPLVVVIVSLILFNLLV